MKVAFFIVNSAIIALSSLAMIVIIYFALSSEHDRDELFALCALGFLSVLSISSSVLNIKSAHSKKVYRTAVRMDFALIALISISFAAEYSNHSSDAPILLGIIVVLLVSTVLLISHVGRMRFKKSA
jgi:cell division protein FtsW (lipid II flippase)